MMFVSEERLIAGRIKDFIKDEEPLGGFYIMLRNGRILYIDDYRNMVKAGGINPQDAYVDIRIGWISYKSAFYYPILDWYGVLVTAYLSKLGFYYGYYIVPTTGLKYVAVAARYENYLAIEISSLDTVVNNLNLPKIVVKVLGKKLISGEKELTKDEYEKIIDTFKSQQLFTGYTPGKAWNIIIEYYNKGNKSLAKEVARITMEYYRIFHPYTICYDIKTWKEIDCWPINL